MASWFAAVGVGTDTGGSLQMPAAYNSLVGVLATQGLVSRAGIVPRSLTQDRAGPLGRSVYDAAVMIGVMAGFDPEDLDTREGLGRYPRITWADQLTVPDLSWPPAAFGKDDWQRLVTWDGVLRPGEHLDRPGTSDGPVP